MRLARRKSDRWHPTAYRKPPRGEVWVHVDKFDNEGGHVWAVQWWEAGRRRYAVTGGVVIQAPCHTQFFGYGERQPIAVIVVVGGRVELGVVAVIRGAELTGKG